MMRSLLRLAATVLLCGLFFLVFAPIAYALRMIGSDPMRRSFDAKAVTYRIASRDVGRDGLRSPS